MRKEIDIAKIPHFDKNDIDEACKWVYEENEPVVITSDGKVDLIIFSSAEYFERYGSFYTVEEIEEIKEACRKAKAED